MSPVGTFRTWPIWSTMSAIGGEADKVASDDFLKANENCFGLWIFAPPFGPSDFMGSASGLYDDALIGRTEWLGKAAQRGFDEPRFEGDPCRLAVGIEFPRHSQGFKRRCDASGCHKHMDD